MTEAIMPGAPRGHYPLSAPRTPAAATSVAGAATGDDIVWLSAALQFAEQCSVEIETFLKRQEKMAADAGRYRASADAIRASWQETSESPHALGTATRLDALARQHSEQVSQENNALLSTIGGGGKSRAALTVMLERAIRAQAAPGNDDIIGPRWHSDFFDKLIEGADDLYGDWIKKYEEALKKFIEFFDGFQEALRQTYITGGDDKTIKLDFVHLRKKLGELAEKFRKPEAGGLASFATREEAAKFIEKLGLEGLHIMEKDGKFTVMVNLGPLEELWVSTYGDGEQNWNISAYNAWLSKKDSILEQYRHASTVLGEKYSRNLQIYDSVIKAISSTIDSINEADKAYIHNLL